MHSEPALKKFKIKEKSLLELESFLDIKEDEQKELNIDKLNIVSEGILNNEEISSNIYVKNLSKTLNFLSKAFQRKVKANEELLLANVRLQNEKKALTQKLESNLNESTAVLKSKNQESAAKEVANLRKMNEMLQEQLEVHEEKQEKLKKVFEALKNQGIELGEVLLEYLSSPENDLEINEGSNNNGTNSMKKSFKRSPDYSKSKSRKVKTECSEILKSLEDADESRLAF